MYGRVTTRFERASRTEDENEHDGREQYEEQYHVDALDRMNVVDTILTGHTE